MDVQQCRTCLSTNDLSPIFQNPDNSDKYTRLLYTAIGLRIVPNDELPQTICSKCITTINDYMVFRQQCHDTLQRLLTQTNKKDTPNITKKEITNVEYNENNINISEKDIGNVKCKENDINVSKKGIKHIENKRNNNNKNKKDIRKFENNKNLMTTSNTDISVAIYHEDVHSEYNDNNLNETFESSNADSDEKPKSKIEAMKDVSYKEFECSVRELLIKGEPIEFINFVQGRKVMLKYVNVDVDDTVEEKQLDTLQCNFCPKVFKSKPLLLRHLRIHNAQHNIICEHCGRKFLTKRHYMTHCRSKHGYQKTDKCSFCDYRGNNPEQVKIHERVHTGERPYVCACGASFHRRSSYLQHLPIHLPTKTVQCPECPSMFKSVTLMKIHRNRHRTRRNRDLARANARAQTQ